MELFTSRKSSRRVAGIRADTPPEPPPEAPRRFRLSAALRHPLAIAAASALIASLLLPAFTRQWQDRQKARELKDGLVQEIDEATTRTVIAVRVLVDRRSREAQTTDERQRAKASARGDERASTVKAFLSALERERDATAGAYIGLLSDWLVMRSVTRSKLTAYFPETEVAEEWTLYANHVTRYVRLASRNPTVLKRQYVAEIARYLEVEQESPGWALLGRNPRSLSPGQYRAFGIADGELSDLLLQKKITLVNEILDAHVAGFSTDTADLFEDLLPFYG